MKFTTKLDIYVKVDSEVKWQKGPDGPNLASIRRRSNYLFIQLEHKSVKA